MEEKRDPSNWRNDPDMLKRIEENRKYPNRRIYRDQARYGVLGGGVACVAILFVVLFIVGIRLIAPNHAVAQLKLPGGLGWWIFLPAALYAGLYLFTGGGFLRLRDKWRARRSPAPKD